MRDFARPIEYRVTTLIDVDGMVTWYVWWRGHVVGTGKCTSTSEAWRAGEAARQLHQSAIGGQYE